MAMPTLKVRGKLWPPDDDPTKIAALEEWVPMDYIMEWFRARLTLTGIENRVLILKSETASGKSTAFPPELYNKFVRGNDGPGIICTQPRVLTAIENVMEILKHYSKTLRLGKNIGWSTKTNKVRLEDVGLMSATIGTLTQQLKVMSDDDIMAKYRFILIDETHERDLQTDMCIYMMKNFLLRNAARPQCPFLVLMSATFDPTSFLRYFGLNIYENFIWCKGATAAITEMWDWNAGRTVNNYPQAAVQLVEKILTENPDEGPDRADILLFMPGKAEITSVKDDLDALNVRLVAGGAAAFVPLVINSPAVRSQNDDYANAINVPVKNQTVTISGKQYKPARRVIISTNVAETGLTLPDLKYVIDSGFNREIEYNPVYDIRALLTKPAPRSRVRQRRGRSGRKFPGVFYPLYPEYIHNRLPELQFPQILLDDVSPIFLDIINEQIRAKTLSAVKDPEFRIEDIDMVDRPVSDSISRCMDKLYRLGYLSIDGKCKLTQLGAAVSVFSAIPPEISRMIMAAYFWGCSVMDVATIGAYLLLDSRAFVAEEEINWLSIYNAGLPSHVTGNSEIVYKMRLLIADDFIHGLILFNAIKYISHSSNPAEMITHLQDWCKLNGLSFDTCMEFIYMRDDLLEQMATGGLDIFAGAEQAVAHSDDFINVITRIKHCIYDGYRCNLLVKTADGYKTREGIHVETPAIFQVNEKALAARAAFNLTMVEPALVLYKSLTLKYNRVSYGYDVIAEGVSCMDGFVSVDRNFA